MIGALYKHMHWADAEIWRAILATNKAANDTRLREIVYHTHLTQHAFLAIWHQKQQEFPKPSDFKDLAAISAWGEDYHKAVGKFLQQTKKPALNETVEIPWAKRFIEEKFGRPAQPPTLAETLFQVAMHTTHHRGQVATRLRELGGDPPLIDFIAWVWFGKPEPDWPKKLN